jgi:hypothetical protein
MVQMVVLAVALDERTDLAPQKRHTRKDIDNDEHDDDDDEDNHSWYVESHASFLAPAHIAVTQRKNLPRRFGCVASGAMRHASQRIVDLNDISRVTHLWQLHVQRTAAS